MLLSRQDRHSKNFEYLWYLYEFHIAKEKLELFKRKYRQNFEDFEKEVLANQQENFEKWDDYMEWKAYLNTYRHLKKILNEYNKMP